MTEYPINKKFKILNDFENLAFLKELASLTTDFKLYGDFEIDPYNEFSTSFQAIYWYLKYTLLINKSITLGAELNLKAFYEENKINIIWLNITDEKNFILECKDGNWYVSFLSHNNIYTFFKNLN